MPPLGLSLLGAALAGGALIGGSAAHAAVMGGPKSMPLEQAVLQGRQAAEAILERAGAETCLRGKLNRALLGLSASCEAAGVKDPLCALADKAVVVTPMSLEFMDQTARQLLELSSPVEAGSPAARGSIPCPLQSRSC